MSTVLRPSAQDIEALLREPDLFALGARAAQAGAGPAAYREDGAVLLVVGERVWIPRPAPPPRPDPLRHPPPAVREVHYLPSLETTPRQVAERLGELRGEYPEAWFHGLYPAWVEAHGLQGLKTAVWAGLSSLALYTGPVEGPDERAAGWEKLLDLELRVVASFVYRNSSAPEALARRLHALGRCPGLATVVPLPARPGDRFWLPDQTTDGTCDAAVLASTRLALARAHLRASWAGLGWKLAQVALSFGADEVAGWGAEEQLAWGDGPPASWVSASEAQAGLAEARRQPVEMSGCAWEF